MHPFIFLMKFKSAIKFSPGVCEHVASDFNNSVNYPLIVLFHFVLTVFHVSFKSCLFTFRSKVTFFHSLGNLAYFTLFRFAEKVNNANKK